MQRYHAGSCTSAVNNSTIGGPSARDIGRIDSSSLPTNFPVSSSVLEGGMEYWRLDWGSRPTTLSLSLDCGATVP
ncbi:mediator of RNA polymerase II transcription subunit 12-like, partial [Trifolium medium]|nr:mediator of RNA polymerase II transcription subunit 12-like [Trifolium medium]